MIKGLQFMSVTFIPLDITDLTILLGISEIILIITAQISLRFFALTYFGINHKKLENTSIIIGLLFLVAISIRMVNILSG
jgi:hypothetical protein